MRKENTISDQFYAFSDAMPGGICVIDRDKTILVWNPTLPLTRNKCVLSDVCIDKNANKTKN